MDTQNPKEEVTLESLSKQITTLAGVSGQVEDLSGKVETLSGQVGALSEQVEALAIFSKNKFDKLDKLENKLDTIESSLKTELKAEIRLEGQKVRDYIDKRIAYYSGTSIDRDHHLEDKTHLTVDTLARKSLLSQEESYSIKSIPVFEPHQV